MTFTSVHREIELHQLTREIFLLAGYHIAFHVQQQTWEKIDMIVKSQVANHLCWHLIEINRNK